MGECAGEPISTRWTQAVKAEIKQSRIAVTRQVVVRIPAPLICVVLARDAAAAHSWSNVAHE